MKTDRALELAAIAAKDDSPWAESLKALADEVKLLQDKVAELETAAIINTFGCWIASDRLPSKATLIVEVYGRSMSSDYKKFAWVCWPSSGLSPWHIWKHMDTPCEELLAKSNSCPRRYDAIAEGK